MNIAAVSPAGMPVGVDAEEIGRVQRPELLAAAFSVAEQQWLDHGTGLVRDEAVLRLWCAKEAAAKWHGTGLQGVPERFEVTFESGGAERAMVQCGDTIVEVFLQRVGNSVIAVAEGHSRIPRVH